MNGFCIMSYPDKPLTKGLANGSKETQHMTWALLEEDFHLATYGQVDVVKDLLAKLARKKFRPFTARITSVEIFGDKSPYSIVAVMEDTALLYSMREELCNLITSSRDQRLHYRNLDYSRKWAFRPHISIAETDIGHLRDIPNTKTLLGEEVDFSTISLMVGNERFDYVLETPNG